MHNLPLFISVAALILFSAFFSGTEMAFSGVNPERLKTLAEKKKSARLALKIVDKYNEFLAAVLIGNNIVNTAASAVATLIIIDLLGENFTWLSTVIMTILVLIFGEIVPKVIAKQMPEKFCAFSAVPIYIMSIVLKPLIWVINLLVSLVSRLWSGSESDSASVSPEDLEHALDIIEDEGVFDEEKCELLQKALDFDDVKAFEKATHRVDMEALDIHDPYEVNIKKILASDYSRIPVYEDTPDKIIGILHMNRVYKELAENDKINIRSLMLPAETVHKTMPLPDVLDKMRESKYHMVIVNDECGGTHGIITMEDILESLVGQIWDESDVIEQEFECKDDTHYEANGNMRVCDFFDEFGIDIEEDEDFENDNVTLGGWLTDMLEGEVDEGNSFKFDNLIITVKEAEENRINRVAVEITEEEKDEDDE